MLTMIWHWITGEILGWGGAGALVAAGAWTLWFLCPTVPFLERALPYKSQLFNIAVAATVFTVAQMYFFTDGYKKGGAAVTARWDAANVRAAADKKKLETDVAERVATVRAEADARLSEMADKFQRQVDDNAKQIATRKGGDCALTDRDLELLRSIK